MRSWVLVLCSSITPIIVLSLRTATLDQRRAIATVTRSVIGPVAGIVPNILFFIGILCFIGFLFSLLLDYLHSRRNV